MKGHIRRRGGKWAVVIELDRDEGGKRQQRWHSGFRTRREAEEELAKLLNQRREGVYVEPNKTTLGEYLGQWIEYLASQGLARRSMVNYEHICRRHLIPALGAHKLAKLNAKHIETYYGEAQLAGNRRTPGGLSARTVGQHHAVLKAALAKAVRWRMLARNPCDDVDPPKPKVYRGRALEQSEIAILLAAAEGSRAYVPVLLALCTGLRKGEILALRWDDNDGQNLTVRRTLEQTAHHVAFKEPKTATSRRTIELPEIAVEALRRHKAAQNEERLLMGSAYAPDRLVFAQPDGSIWTVGSLDRLFARIVRSSGLGRVRFHDLRHSHATQLLKAGENIKVVSERLGHASIRITLDLYAHVLPGMQKAAAQKVDVFMRAALGG